MKVLFYLVWLLAITVTSVYAGDLAPPDQSIDLDNKMGSVTFSHQNHHELTCQSCHHTGKFEKCSTCHGSTPKTPSAKKAFHALCKDCHSQTKEAPGKCKDCHQKK